MTGILLSATIGETLDASMLGFDMAIYRVFGAIQNDILTMIAKMFTSLGDEMFVIPMAILGLILCLFKRSRKYGASLVIAIAIGTIITNLVLKPMVLRVRPYNTLQGDADYWLWYTTAGMLSESDYSFPSGHTTGAFEIAFSMMLCFAADKRKKLAAMCPILALLVGCSRIYLMVHYPTDVLGGMLAGIFAGVVGYFAAKLICKLFAKHEKLDNTVDVERIVKKGIPTRTFALLVTAFCVVVFAVSCGKSVTEGGEEAIRCAYNEEYDCQNEARVNSDKYPPIDGKCYCKIHWKQLTGADNAEDAAENSADAPAGDEAEETAALDPAA
ncbi:MAG: phosphatase PAP2 family protein [Clostridia bacterium]|nr:phosphatase PAP2 family protein [Clostridia bacterium]